jgi:hypothetical protein
MGLHGRLLQGGQLPRHRRRFSVCKGHAAGCVVTDDVELALFAAEVVLIFLKRKPD